MAAISLDDIGSFAQPAKKKGKAKVKAKTTAVKAKTVSKGVKVKKKKKSDPSKDILPSQIDADQMYSEIAATQKALEKSEKKPKKKKKENAVESIKKAKKKKKVQSTDLAVLEGQLMAVVDDIPDAIKQENDQIQEYLTMFTQCQAMARECEKMYLDKKQSRDIYALMKLYDQMREIIADLRALRDVSQLADILNQEVLGPFAESAGTILVSVFHQVNAWNKKNLPVELIANAQAAMQNIIRKSAKDVEQSYQAGLDKTVQIFSASA